MENRGERSEGQARESAVSYEPPVLRPLGSLIDLTRGGDASAEDDGYGYAGASGVL